GDQNHQILLLSSTSFFRSEATISSVIMDSGQKGESPRVRRRRKKAKKSHRGAYSIFWKIREQWKLLGFFEIKPDHEFYDLTCMLKDGLWASVQEAIDAKKKSAICFEMRTYAGPAFAWFRHHLGMVDSEYQNSLSCESSYLQFISNSKSKADFFLTNDKRFFLKTQSKQEIRFILSNLPKYIQYLKKYPHSLLVRFLGVHSIIVPQEKKKYFIIMQSIFYPHERIAKRYDIKGCEVGRLIKDAPNSEIIMVFKDLNFGKNSISLGLQKDWFIQQIELDTQFLKELDVIDYSLLVGLQPLHEDERAMNQAVENIMARTTLSCLLLAGSTLSQESSQPNLQNEVSTISGMDDVDAVSSLTGGSSLERLSKVVPAHHSTIHNLLAFYLMQKSSYYMPPPNLSTSEQFLREMLASQMAPDGNTELSSVLPSISFASLSDLLPESQNRRLLSSTKNPLHVIDGPDFRYFVGIIDFFTVYGFRKKLEHLWKSIRYRGQRFSTVNPSDYAERLCQWVKDHTSGAVPGNDGDEAHP
ncbi:hypothetical protein lerEdw1_006748, partial [Lerista edwardsae]